METLLFYFTKVALIQIALVACYHLLFRNDTFYRAIRWYFITGIAASFLLPWLNLYTFTGEAEQTGTVILLQQYANNIASVPQTAWWQNLSLTGLIVKLWLLVGVYFLWRISRQFTVLFRLNYTNKADYGDFTVKYMPLPTRPFSFGRCIYLNPALHTQKQLDEIIAHELIHIRQFHTFDIVLSALNQCVFWWNPAAWYLNKAVRNNLEYIVDGQMLQQGADRKHYQYHLLQISQLAYSNSFTNNFNLFNLKNRIKMMNKEKTRPVYLAKWVLLIPVTIVLTILISTNVSLADDKKGKSTKVGVLNITNKDGNPPYVVIDGKESSLEKLNEIDPANIVSVDVLKGDKATEEFGDKGKSGVIKVTTGKSDKTGEKKDVKMSLNYNGNGGVKISGNFDGADKVDVLSFVDDDINVTIDGKKATKAELKALNPENIAEVSVNKINGEKSITIIMKK